MTKILKVYLNGINNWSLKVWERKKKVFFNVSNMPKDNHSVMQLYLDGFENNFFLFFIPKIKNQ